MTVTGDRDSDGDTVWLPRLRIKGGTASASGHAPGSLNSHVSSLTALRRPHPVRKLKLVHMSVPEAA